MSRFGWAYVSDLLTGSNTNPGGSDKAIQFASGSTFSGSTNFTFEYTTNTVRLTGTLYADNLIVSSSTIFKSGSTKFGDDVADTHQFTGSVFTSNNLTVIGQVSASVALNTAGTIEAGSNITSLGIVSGSSFLSNGNITSNGIISSSSGLNTAGTITAGTNITSTGGTISASLGLQTAGSIRANNGLIITGSSFVQALSSSNQIQAASFRGDGFNITGVRGQNVVPVGVDWAVQCYDPNSGGLTGSAALIVSQSSTVNLATFSSTGIVKASRTRTSNTTLSDGDYYLFMSGTNLTATLGTSQTGREVIIYNYGGSNVLATGSGVSGFYANNGNLVSSIVIAPTAATDARSLKLVYLSASNTWNVI